MNSYEILEPIGRGGMGRVFRGRHLGLDRLVALKFIDSELSSDEIVVERFLREARLLARLDHPNVVRVHDAGRDDEGRPYIVMELLEGIALSESLRRGPMAPEQAVNVSMQVLAALEEAHRLDIIHRDVKPSNIRLLPSGKVKLLDFGIARDEMLSSVTHTGKIIGTPAYMSPEQADGRPTVPQSDLYSLGIVLYEMLTGSAPFRAETPLAVLRMHTDHPPPSLPSKFPAGLRSVVSRALEKKSSNRFPSATAMRESLAGALAPRGGSGISAPPRTPKPDRFKDPVSVDRANSHRTAWIVLAVLGLAGLGVIGMALTGIASYLNARATRDVVENEPIPFEIRTEPTPTIPMGRSRIARNGKNGNKATTYEVVMSGSQLISRTPKGEPVITPPVHTLKLIGTSKYQYCPKYRPGSTRHRDDWDSNFCKDCGYRFPPQTEPVVRPGS